MKKDFRIFLHPLLFSLFFFAFLSPSYAIPLLDDTGQTSILRRNDNPNPRTTPHEGPGPLYFFPNDNDDSNSDDPFDGFLCVEEYGDGEITCAGLNCYEDGNCKLVFGVVSSPDDRGIGFGLSWGF